jgi:hypothetical protein
MDAARAEQITRGNHYPVWYLTQVSHVMVSGVRY